LIAQEMAAELVIFGGNPPDCGAGGGGRFPRWGGSRQRATDPL